MNVQDDPSVGILTPYHEPSSKLDTTPFPLDGVDLATVSDEQLVAISKTAPVLYRLMGTNLVRLSKRLVLKFGLAIQIQEIEAMKLVLSRTSITTPKLYRYFFTDSESRWDKRGWFVMDYVEGDAVEDIWDNIGHAQRMDIVKQVADYISQLQSIRFEQPGPIGGGGGKCRGYWFSMYEAGPFENRDEFNAWFSRKLQFSKKFRHANEALPDFNYSTFVLVHHDIHPWNLILDRTGKVWLIDWGNAGAYPAIFEAAGLRDTEEPDSFDSLLLPLIYNDQTEREHLMGTLWALQTAGWS